MCVDSSIDLVSSSSMYFLNISKISFLTTGSSPLVGSSNIKILGLCAIAVAIFNFIFIPLEKSFISLSFGKSNCFNKFMYLPSFQVL